jgi:hypothetical protein
MILTDGRGSRMKARNERRKRTAKCPMCGELFSPQGLNGHLRFTHGMRGDEMRQQQGAAVIAGGVAERSRHTRDLIAELETIRAKLNELRPKAEKSDGWGGHTPDGAITDACEALEARELEVRNEIRKLQGKPPLAWTTVRRSTFWGPRESVELVEQPQDETLEHE